MNQQLGGVEKRGWRCSRCGIIGGGHLVRSWLDTDGCWLDGYGDHRWVQAISSTDTAPQVTDVLKAETIRPKSRSPHLFSRAADDRDEWEPWAHCEHCGTWTADTMERNVLDQRGCRSNSVDSAHSWIYDRIATPTMTSAC